MSTELVRATSAVPERTLDADRLIARWQEGRSAQTLRAYTNDLAHFAAWLQAPSPGAAIDALLGGGQGRANETVRSYRSAMLDAGAAPATINRRLSALRSLVSLASEFGTIPFELSTRNVRSESYRDTRGPEPGVMETLLAFAKNQPHAAKAARDVAIFLLLGYGLALRRAEVVGLDLADLDVAGGRLQVLRKGKRERQWLRLDPTLARVLQAWLAKRGVAPGPLFVQAGKGGRLLEGRRLSGDGVHDILQTMGARLGVKLRPHGLRHAGITAALDATNGDVRAVREFSGHASIETVLCYDDNRRDLGGEVAGKVMQRVASLFVDAD